MRQFIRSYYFILCLAILALNSACSSDDIEIEAEVRGLGTQNIHIVYNGDNGTADDVVAAQNDRFTTRLSSQDVTVVNILDARHMLVARFAAQNGDHIKIDGDLAAPHLIKITGNDATEQWLKFRSEHDKLYAKPMPEALDREIEKWITEHPKQLSSTLLLLIDYSDLTNINRKQKLLNVISPEARPDHLIASVEWLNEYYSRTVPRKLPSLNLCGTKGDFEMLNVVDRPALLYFWSNDKSPRADIIRAIRNRLKADNNQLLVADILLDADTLQWAATCQADSASWKHYWVPGGVMDIALRDLRIPSAPFFIATDANGKVTYRGSSVTEALKKIP